MQESEKKISSLLFATNNAHKVTEIQSAIGNQLQVISLAEAGIDIEIPEPHDTLEQNSLEKARTIHHLTGLDCFSEDTGLEVDALDGEPGVRSARYAGEPASAQKNMSKLLQELGRNTNRTARFRTVISLIWANEEFLFDGVCEGIILEAPQGREGFGYDPVFQPLGSELAFAEMSLAEKNKYSHRRKAADKLILFLQQRLSQA
ncbi:MAG: RdgB/HAM1 family non-canonical purine NTP pyrophosphatase [Chitinophagaceae bacterium]|nr:RdgB/HAM1 family non-canonical purine NTP pyrophosphatase [Chitinophagaceae bacterium]